MVVTDVLIPRVPQLFPEDQDEVPLPDSPFTAARWVMGGEKYDRSGQLGIQGLYSTFARDKCW